MPKDSNKEASIFDAKLYRDFKSNVDAIKKLTALSNALKDKDQEDETVQELEGVAKCLVGPTLIHSKDKDTRLLVACCLADIIRLFAPNAPYSEDQLKEIFQLFIEQLQMLDRPRESSYTKVFYLLEKLALVKAFILLVDLDDDLVLELFKTLLGLVGPEHSVKAQSYMKDVMVACIEEADLISQQVLDLLLAHILPAARRGTDVSDSSAKLAQNVIAHCATRLQNPMLQFLSDALVGTRLSESDLKSNAHEIIYELYKISPLVVREVLPQLDAELKVDDDVARRTAVELLAKVFGAPTPIDPAHRSVLGSFLGRLNDNKDDIRLATMQALPPVIVNHPEVLDAELQRTLAARVCDNDERVRRAALPAVAEAAIAAPERFGEHLLKVAIERFRDRKPAVRVEAVKQLGRLYAKLDERYGEKWPESVLNVFGQLPRKIIASYSVADDVSLKVNVEKVLDTELLPEKVNGNVRAAALRRLLSHLDETAVAQLGRMLHEKRLLREDFAAFLELKKAKNEEEITKKANRIAARLPFAADKSVQALVRLDFKQEATLTSAMKHLVGSEFAYDKARASKHKALEEACNNGVFATLAQRLSVTVVSSECVAQLLAEAREKGSAEVGGSVTGFLERAALEFPALFEAQAEQLVKVIEGQDEPLINTALVIAARVGSLIPAAVAAKLKPQFQGFATTGTPRQAKYSVRAIVGVLKDHEKVLRLLLERLKGPKLTDENLGANLAARAQIAVKAPALAQDALDEELVRKVLASEKVSGADKVLALKLLVRGVAAQGGAEHVKHALKLLGALVKARGDTTAEHTTSAADAILVRKYALSGLLFLARTFDGHFQPADFLNLVWFAHDPSVEVREHVLNKMHKYVSSAPLMHVKYFVVFAMFGGDRDKTIAPKAKAYLESGVQRHREALRSLAGKADARHATLLLPEYALPWLVYALAYRPDFPADKDLRHTAQCAAFFLAHLQQQDSSVFIDQLLKYTKVADNANPKADPNAFRVVCDVALKVHHSRQENRRGSASQNYPAQIFLPQQLYKVVPGNVADDKSYLPAGWHLPDLRARAAAGADDESSRVVSPVKKAPPPKAASAGKRRRSGARAAAESDEEPSAAESASEQPAERVVKARTSPSADTESSSKEPAAAKSPKKSPAKSPAKKPAKRASPSGGAADEPSRPVHGRKKKRT